MKHFFDIKRDASYLKRVQEGDHWQEETWKKSLTNFDCDISAQFNLLATWVYRNLNFKITSVSGRASVATGQTLSINGKANL